VPVPSPMSTISSNNKKKRKTKIIKISSRKQRLKKNSRQNEILAERIN
jgi:hypothetical protein